MAILAGFDVHRAQITFDALDTDTGEVLCGRMRGDRDAVSEWVRQFRRRRLGTDVQHKPARRPAQPGSFLRVLAH
jgi:hypothetical protein